MGLDDKHMESRVNNLEARLNAIEHQVQRVTDAVLGTTDGKPGIMEINRLSLEASRINSLKLDGVDHTLIEQNKVLDTIKQTHARFIGGLLVASVVWPAVFALVLKYVKLTP